MIRRALIEQIGLFDPRYFLYFEEVDFCFSAKKAGWEVVSYPDTTVVHIGGESAKSEGAVTQHGRQLEALQIESELLYFRKNHGFSMVVVDVLLSSIADFIGVVKLLLGRKTQRCARSFWLHTVLKWSLFIRTRLGTQPTR